MAGSTTDFTKEKKAYKIVMWCLFLFTGITLALGKINFLDFGPPGPDWRDLLAGLSLAGVKASLVALIFMHLNHEKGLVYKMLLFTFAFFLSLMGLTLFAGSDPIIEQFETFQTTNGQLTEELTSDYEK